MEISFDPAKRAITLRERGIDFADAPLVFGGLTLTVEDDREAYPERRFQTYGLLDDRMVVVVWTEVEFGRRIISMRKCNERERNRYRERLD